MSKANTHKHKLSHRVANASSLSIIGRFVGRGFDLGMLAILSRLLSPSDFGLTALAMTSVTIAETVSQMPLAQALIRVKDPTQEMYNTAFTLALLRGCVLAVVLSVVAVIMSFVYHEPRLIALITALSLAPIFRGLSSPKMIVFIKNMDFRQDAGIGVAGKFGALIVSSVIAFSTHSYWAIAAATISTPIIMAALSYILAPYMPRLGLSRWEDFRSLVGWNSLSQLLAAMNWQMDRLLLGYFVPKDSLGRYSMAGDLSGIPFQAIIVPLGGPLYSAYSARLNEHPSVMAGTYMKSCNAMLAIGGPVLLGLSILAVPLVRLFLGPSWTETGHILQWLALFGVFALPVYHVGSLALVLNQARMGTWRIACEFIVAIPALLFGSMYFGIPGVIVARGFATLVILGVGMETAHRLIGCSIKSQLMHMHRTVIALAIMGVGVFLLEPLVADESIIMLTLRLGMVSAVGGIVYISVLFSLWRFEGEPGGIERVMYEKVNGLISRIRKTEHRT